MYLSQLKLSNFRKYKNDTTINLKNGLNVIVGENDSGKTAIIDAIRLLVGTQSNEFYRITNEDFYYDKKTKEFSNKLKIQCIIKELSADENSRFLEILNYENGNSYIKLSLVAERIDKKIIVDIFYGELNDDDKGNTLPSLFKEYFKTIFLKPLRDAKNEMISKKGSRLSQILSNYSDPLFNDSETNELVKIFKDANALIKEKLSNIKVTNGSTEIKVIDSLKKFLETTSIVYSSELAFGIADEKLKSILESISLTFGDINEGLGVENVLFIATEFLLFKNIKYYGLKLALIEELEAHLHPQTQLALIKYIDKNYTKNDGQIIMTTHSPNIVSNVDIEKIILCKNNIVYNLSAECTSLEKGDYNYLQRFLDSTKSNMFFSNKLIFVEGYAEAIILPVLAEKLNIPFEENSITLVNVNGTAFLRYSRIFIPKNNIKLGMKISIITDLDDEENVEELTVRKKNYFDSLPNNISTFVSTKKTLEKNISYSCLYKLLLQSIFEAQKEENSNKYPLTEEKISECIINTTTFIANNEEKPNLRDLIFDYMIQNKISKAIVAQRLAEKLMSLDDLMLEQVKVDVHLKYIIDALNYLVN